MSDHGTTAIQVSPVLEDTDMAEIGTMFSKLANLIVEASSLAKSIPALRDELNAIKRDAESYKAETERLSGQVADLRRERDQARYDNAELERDLRQARTDIEGNIHDLDKAYDQIERLKAELETARKERDEFLMRNLEDSDTIKKLQDRYNRLKGILSEDEPQVEQPSPAPTNPEKPIEGVPVQAEPEPKAAEDYPHSQPTAYNEGYDWRR